MLQKYENEEKYTQELHSMRSEVLKELKGFYLGKDLCDDKIIKSFEAKIGSKTDLYARVKNKSYDNVMDFRDAWFLGMVNAGKSEIRDMLRHDEIRNYTILFLERMYIRDSKKYAKLKLKSNDREIYLGDNKNVLGVFIAPKYDTLFQKGWCSDEWKGFNEKYDYLTLGQLKKEGYLKGNIQKEDEFKAELYAVNSIEDIEDFYSNFTNSGSPFERKFIKCYIDFVKSQHNWERVPLLLPEVRWNPKSVYHKYRVDYLVINYYTGKRLAIELSPNSTHLSNSNVKSEWIKENDKRNKYFFDYHVPTITFTNEYLNNIQQCFDMIKEIFTIPEYQKQRFEDIVNLI